jgi:hypothetical protein
VVVFGQENHRAIQERLRRQCLTAATTLAIIVTLTIAALAPSRPNYRASTAGDKLV